MTLSPSSCEAGSRAFSGSIPRREPLRSYLLARAPRSARSRRRTACGLAAERVVDLRKHAAQLDGPEDVRHAPHLRERHGDPERAEPRDAVAIPNAMGMHGIRVAVEGMHRRDRRPGRPSRAARDPRGSMPLRVTRSRRGRGHGRRASRPGWPPGRSRRRQACPASASRRTTWRTNGSHAPGRFARGSAEAPRVRVLDVQVPPHVARPERGAARSDEPRRGGEPREDAADVLGAAELPVQCDEHRERVPGPGAADEKLDGVHVPGDHPCSPGATTPSPPARTGRPAAVGAATWEVATSSASA